MVSSALQALRRTVTVSWPKEHEERGKELLLQVSSEGHTKIMADARSRSGVEPQWDAYANKPGNTNLGSVKLPGPIVYNYRYPNEVIGWILAELIKASPVGGKGDPHPGLYRDSHTLFVNFAPVDGIPPNIRSTDDIFVANPVPYARRLEVGKLDNGRDFLISVPNRIYERIAKKAEAKFKSVARIYSTYATLPNSYTLAKDNPDRQWLKNRSRWYYRKRQRADRAKGAIVKAPAIVVEVLS